MLAKLLALLAAAKGATTATIVVAAAAVATVGVTTPEVQDAIRDAASAVGLHAEQDSDCGHGQPAIVAQRNAADKLLRDAYQKDHKALLDLRGSGKDHDNQAVSEVIRKYDEGLRDILNTALNTIGADTLGRKGQNKDSASPKPSPASASPSSPTPKPTCPPTGSTGATGATGATRATGSTVSTGSTGATGAGRPSEDGRVTVANRTTLDPKIKAIVDKAVADMDALVGKAKADIAKLPPAEHGKSSDQPGNKPEDRGGGKPPENPANKPSPKPTK